MKRVRPLMALWFLLSLAAGEQFKVGGEGGWREPDSNSTDVYALWAGRMRFRVGDSIYFEYSNDSVLLVDKRGYYHCNMTNVTASFDDGKTVFNLDRPGLFYFISGAPDHCKNGQRLSVDVMAPPPSLPWQPTAAPTFPGPSQSPLPSTADSTPAPPLLVLVAVAHIAVSGWTALELFP